MGYATKNRVTVALQLNREELVSLLMHFIELKFTKLLQFHCTYAATTTQGACLQRFYIPRIAHGSAQRNQKCHRA